jgi:predicted RecA/RadA family phage recombinase
MTVNYRQPGVIKEVVATGTVTAGDFVQSGGIHGFALNDATTGQTLQVLTAGIIRVAKATGYVPAAGDPAFWDVADAAANADFRNNVLIGVYAQSALTGDTGAWVILDPALDVFEVVRIPLRMAANDVQVASFLARWAGKVVGIDYYTTAKPSSAAGTVTLTSNNVGVSDNDLFSSLNLETITDNALTPITLTATAADLVIAQAGLAEFLVTSDNADLAENDGVDLFVYFQRT